MGDAGLMFPTDYTYAVTAEMIVSSLYESTGTISSTNMDTAIDAGVSINLPGGGASASAAIKEGIQVVASDLDVEEETTVNAIIKGAANEIDTSCFDWNNCAVEVKDYAKGILENW